MRVAKAVELKAEDGELLERQAHDHLVGHHSESISFATATDIN